jgi:hypothetical protein
MMDRARDRKPRPEVPAEDGSQKLRDLAEAEAKRIAERGKKGKEGVAALPGALEDKTTSLKDLDALLNASRRSAPPKSAPPTDPYAD